MTVQAGKAGETAVYRLLIIEDESGIAEAIHEQAALWDIDTHIVEDFRAVMAEFAAFCSGWSIANEALRQQHPAFCQDLQYYNGILIRFAMAQK